MPATPKTTGAATSPTDASSKPPEVLSFGIPSLDELLGSPPPSKNGAVLDQPAENFGIHVHSNDPDDSESLDSSTSLCLIGPDGTGKSILALHLAAQYASMADPQARIFYASTDLSFPKAMTVWHHFALEYPYRRHETMEKVLRPGRARPRRPAREDHLRLQLKSYTPIILGKSDVPDTDARVRPLTEYLTGPPRVVEKVKTYVEIPRTLHNVAFIDLESNTAGDDWGLINRLLATLERPSSGESRNLLIVDAVEGLEMFGGRRDAFGHQRDRRSRIAQVLRAAKEKCHVVFIVEEPRDHARLPEEFVCDVVIRLRVERRYDYDRRTIEIEKLRGQHHVRGRHDFLIRKGAGSQTRGQHHADDPIFTVRDDDGKERTRSYFQVLPSLHYLSRKIMEDPRKADDTPPGSASTPTTTTGPGSAPLPDPLAAFVREQPKGLCGFGIRYLDEMLGNSHRDRTHETQTDTSPPNGGTGSPPAASRNEPKSEPASPPPPPPPDWHPLSDPNGLPWGYTTALIGDEGTHKSRVGRAFLAQTFRGPNNEWVHDRGVALLLTMHPLDNQQLAGKFIHHLGALPVSARSRVALDQIQTNPGAPLLTIDSPKGREDVVALMQKSVFCRRLEIHSMTSAVLFHIIHSLVQQGIEHLKIRNDISTYPDTNDENSPGQVRLVIDDWSSIRAAYPEVRNDPLFLPFLLFYLQRRGITTLIIDTQPGRLGHILSHESDRALRSLAHHHIYTWHVTFFGEKRVAIAALPPVSDDKPVVVRELRPFDGRPEELIVDPHFEYYTGFVDDTLPKLIPLQVRLFTHSQSQPDYQQEMKQLFGRLFTSLDGRTDGDPGIIPPEAGNYDLLREFAYLQGAKALDHALVLQVDEFWLQDSEALLDLSDYVHAETADAAQVHDPVEDPYRLFQPQVANKDWLVLPMADEETWKSPPSQSLIDTETPDITGDQESQTDNQDQSERTEVPKDAAAADSNKDAPTTSSKRIASFLPRGYTLDAVRPGRKTATVDRVPYTVDFGFLMVDRNAWQAASEQSEQVKGVWDRLRRPVATAWDRFRMSDASTSAPTNDSSGGDPSTSASAPRGGATSAPTNDSAGGDEGTAPPSPIVSWREFFTACESVASAGTTARQPFDVDLSALESLSCLVLELFASEIDLLEAKSFWIDRLSKGKGWQELLVETNSDWAITTLENVQRYMFPARDDVDGFGLPELCALYQRPLFRAWLLLAAVWWPDRDRQAGFRLANRPASAKAVASRHWYSTACPARRDGENLETPIELEPLCLPGTRTVRGDWFLGIARGSRSRRLAHRALDLLCSRRGNLTRTQLGLGLPTRGFQEDVDNKDADITGFINAEFRSPLVITDDQTGIQRHLQLRECWALGDVSPPEEKMPPEKRKSWIWRSSLKDYDRHSRLWLKWLVYTFDRMEAPLRAALPNGNTLPPDQWDRARRQLCLDLYDGLENWAKHPDQGWPEDEKVVNHKKLFARGNPPTVSFERLCGEFEQAVRQASIRPLESPSVYKPEPADKASTASKEDTSAS